MTTYNEVADELVLEHEMAQNLQSEVEDGGAAAAAAADQPHGPKVRV